MTPAERVVQELFGTDTPHHLVDAGDVGGALSGHAREFVFGQLYADDALTAADRQLVAITALAVLGAVGPQLESHLRAALRVGLRPDQLETALTLVTAFAGFPRALNAMAVLRAVLDDAEGLG